MFEDLIREVKRLERAQTIKIGLPSDPDGFLDRECPASNCQTNFKVLADHWEQKVSHQRAFCPICRAEAPANDWATKQQLKYAREIAMSQLERQVNGALERGARTFNQRYRSSGFVSLSLSYKPGPVRFVFPIAAAKIMEQRFTCQACGCAYASIGAAFFCPACGYNSAVTTFKQTLETVRNTMDQLHVFKGALEQSVGADVAMDGVRLIIEQALGRLVGGFECFSEALFARTPAAATVKVPRGAFQRLNDASDLWQAAVSLRYHTVLSVQDFRRMNILFQRRHLLMHREGIVDQKYLDQTNDTEYSVGQRLVIRERDVLSLIEILTKVSQALCTAVGT